MADRTGSMAKIKLTVTAVADRHLGEHLKSPTGDPSFRKMMNGVRRQLFRPSKSKAPLDKEILQDAFDLIEGGGRLQDWRTLCRLNLQFYGMLRWQEVSELKMDDIRFDESGLVLHIRKSKTDQLGEGAYVRIQATEEENCPVELTRLYLHKLNYGTENGFFQPQIRTYKDGTQSGVWFKKLGYSSALEDTKAMMAMIGRDPTLYGEHSGRRGGATTASEAGVSWLDLKRHGRWASDSAPQRYIEQTDKNANRVAAALAHPLPSASRQSQHEYKTPRQELQQQRQANRTSAAGPKKQIWNESQQWAAEQRRVYAAATASAAATTRQAPTAASATATIRQAPMIGAQRLINLEIPVLVRSLKSSNVELG